MQLKIRSVNPFIVGVLLLIFTLLIVGVLSFVSTIPASYKTPKSTNCNGGSVANYVWVAVDAAGAKPTCLRVYGRQAVHISNGTDQNITATLAKFTLTIVPNQSANIAAKDIAKLAAGVHLLTITSSREEIVELMIER